ALRRARRHRIGALGGERVWVLRVALDGPHRPEHTAGADVDLLPGVYGLPRRAVHADRAGEHLEEVGVVLANQHLELSPAHLGADGVTVDLERRTAGEVLDVHQGPARFLRHLDRVQVAGLLELDPGDLDLGVGRHPDVRTVGKRDWRVAGL